MELDTRKLKVVEASSVLFCLSIATSTTAQIVPDATLPANSNVNSDGNTSTINGGTIAGSNLFHSFEQFSIPTGNAAYFNNATGIQNIISRVTGSSVSNIDGLISANGTANLFLLNPNGIIFGVNASLDIGGSFLVSTASSLNFADGTQFSATAPQTAPLLTVSVPIGLQFGENPANILNKSQFNLNGATNSFFLPIGLQVQQGKTLALIGGDVVLEGGSLTAPRGRIELGSVAGPGLVSINLTNNSLSLGYEGVQNFQDILLSQGAIVDASGFGGGNIRVQGRRVTLTDSSQIGIENLGGLGAGGSLIVNASEVVELIGESGVFTGATNSGVGGNLTIATRQLIVRNGSFISTNTFLDIMDDDPRISFGGGQGGVLNVTASESVELSGTSENGFTSGLFTQTTGSGNAGNLSIATGKLVVRDGAQLSASAFGEGSGGNLIVTVSESVELTGTSANDQSPSGLFTTTTGNGNAGDLSIATGRLVVRDGARVSVSSQGAGNAGNLEVVARSIQLNNQAAFTAESASGSGGNIRLQAQDIVLLSRNSMISAISGTQGRRGNAGNITIDTDLFVASENSDIIANSFAGPGANVQITAREFLLSPNSEIIVNGKEADIEPIEPVVDLEVSPTEVVDASGLIIQGCPADTNVAGRGGSKFIVTGRGGLPPTPREALNGDTVLEDWGMSAITSRKPSSESKGEPENRFDAPTLSTLTTRPTPDPIVPAQGWVIDKGEVTLTAQAPNATPGSFGSNAVECSSP